MKRNILLLTATVIMSLVMAFSLTACGIGGGHPADTFYMGAISAEEFDSKEDAAKAFVMTEINGEVTKAKFVSYTKQADLTADEIESLDISAEDKQNIESAEKGNVSYAVEKKGGGVYTSAEEEKLYLVIIITYKNKKIRYYSPVINTGDVLTKSYYDKVFASENFKNVTVGYNFDYTQTIYAEGLQTDVKASLVVEALLDSATYSYLKMTLSMDLGELGAALGTPNTTVTKEELFVKDASSPLYNCYFTRTVNGLNGENEQWVKHGVSPSQADDDSDSSGVSEKSELFDKIMPDFDYSYFIKTESGFKVNDEKLSEYFTIALRDAASTGGSIGDNLSDAKATAEYYVYDGKITGSELYLDYSSSESIYGTSVSYSIAATCTTDYRDYGTTVVTVPESLDLSKYM